MKSVCASLFLFTSALGSWGIPVLVAMVNANPNDPWISDVDANAGHLDWFFFLLAGMMVVTTLEHIRISRKYTYKEPEKEPSKNASKLGARAISSCSVDN